MRPRSRIYQLDVAPCTADVLEEQLRHRRIPLTFNQLEAGNGPDQQ